MERTRLGDVLWLLVLHKVVINSIECKKFTYKINISMSLILCVW
jgi:hypothetical protein